eukprot:CAMPEP_0118936472 /NCGR_PEP_ID=MMETSP1169-20130426/19086_1 /TAXON_ID=36882 /ORGANISM="Pyramimonas obovata, Strain CCMP722" /LENGTH=434 /DNA_ID=CAMNT_0006879743 /DNA_START=472 /DNA_END=1773 /DNA_ORIENTATION=+
MHDASSGGTLKKTLTAYKRRTVQRNGVALSEEVLDEALDELLSHFEPFALQIGAQRKEIHSFVEIMEKAHMQTMKLSRALLDAGGKLGLDSSEEDTVKPLCGLANGLEPILNVLKKELVQLDTQVEELKVIQKQVAEHKHLQLEFDHYVHKLKGLCRDKVASNTHKLNAARAAYELHKTDMAHRLRSLLDKAPTQQAVLLGNIMMCDSTTASRTATACGDLATAPPVWLTMAAKADVKLTHLLKERSVKASTQISQDAVATHNRLLVSQRDLALTRQKAHAAAIELAKLKSSRSSGGKRSGTVEGRAQLEVAQKVVEEAERRARRSDKDAHNMRQQLRLASDKVQLLSEGFMSRIAELEDERLRLAKALEATGAPVPGDLLNFADAPPTAPSPASLLDDLLTGFTVASSSPVRPSARAAGDTPEAPGAARAVED